MTFFSPNRSWRPRSFGARAALAAGLVAAAAATAIAVPAASASSAHKASGAPLVVWYDAARAAFVKEYKATHPHANIKWVLYDGDSNGSGTLQSKFALYNRVGWKAGVAPDVVFDEENYEAGWLGEPPFNDLLNLAQYIPKKVWSKDEGLGDCLINGKLLCLRNDNAANVLWVNTQAVVAVLPRAVASHHVAAVRRRWAVAGEEPPRLLHRRVRAAMGRRDLPLGQRVPHQRGHRQSEASG